MHIPDGFLSTPVWAAMDVTAAPAVGYIVRRTQRDFDTARIPLLGVLGAFVFAAQMISIPVGMGTSAHLLGSALLTFTLGPWAASVVMCAILGIQAMVFQDGGILALGANTCNIAIAGVAAAWLPLRLLGRNRWAVFAGGALSVLVSGVLALCELRLSHIAIPATMFRVSLIVFAVSALAEGAITVAVVNGLQVLRPGQIRGEQSSRLLANRGGLIVALIVSAGLLIASTAPDAIQALGQQTSRVATSLFFTPAAGYELAWLYTPWLRKLSAATAGVLLIYTVCGLIGRGFARRGRA